MVKEALSGFRRERDLPKRWLSLASYAAADVWDDETWRLLSERDVERARRDGALAAMPLALSHFGYVRAISGEVALAESLLDEIRAATEATGIPSHCTREVPSSPAPEGPYWPKGRGLDCGS